MLEYLTRPEVMERLVIGPRQLDNLIDRDELTPIRPFGDGTPANLTLFPAAQIDALSRRSDLRGSRGPAASARTEHRHASPAAVDRAKRAAARLFGDLAQRRDEIEAAAETARHEEEVDRLLSYATHRAAELGGMVVEKVSVDKSVMRRAKARKDWPKW